MNINDLFHFLCYKNVDGRSYNSTNFDFTFKKYLNVSNTAIINRRKLIDVNDFQTINENMLKLIYKSDRRRIIAVDGSQLNFIKNIIESNGSNFDLSKSKQYRSGLLSSLIDIENNIPINFSLVSHSNERNVFISQMKYLRPKDIVIFDRGYFSKDLMKKLIGNKIDFIFRLPKSNGYCKMLKSNQNELVLNNIKIVKYEFKNSNEYVKKYKKNEVNYETYYVLTSLIDNKYSIKYLKDLYHKRWNVETNFRYCKYYTSLGRINSKSVKYINQDIQITNFIFILSGYIEKLLIDKCNISNKKINKKISLSILMLDILHYLIKRKIDNRIFNKISNILSILLKFLVLIQNERHYKRETKIPINHWLSKWKFKR
jgi:hypothetical protein